MCRLYGFRVSRASKVDCTLIRAQNAFLAMGREGAEESSATQGWGLAIYRDHKPRIERQAWTHYDGERFPRAAARAYTRTVLAHVRRATVGDAALENTHPFNHGAWTLVHSGTLPNFAALRDRLRAAMTDEQRDTIGGVTDSEHLFHYLLSLRARRPEHPLMDTLRDGVRQVIAWCREIDPHAEIGLDLMLTNGDELAGTCLGGALFALERDGAYDCEICGYPHGHNDPERGYRAVAIASQEISHEDWRPVPDGSVFGVTRDIRLSTESL